MVLVYLGAGIWKDGVVCSERSPGQNSVAHILKPCCFNLRGHCQLISHDHCTFLGGTYTVDGPDHCSQVHIAI